MGQVFTGQGVQNHLGGQGFDSYNDRIRTGVGGFLTVSGGVTSGARSINGIEINLQNSIDNVVTSGHKLAKTPVGRSGDILKIVTRNQPTTIDGTKFTGHALDQMQARGVISPSAVLDVIKNPTIKTVGNTPGTTVFIKDNLKVITNQAGDVITVIPQ
jgi:hypothetical protein